MPRLALLTALVPTLLGACGGSECSPGLTECSADALTLTVCEDGKRKAIACMAAEGRLCEGGMCVDPWQYGAPAFDRCDGYPQTTPESLREKMLYFEGRARNLHLNPSLRWITPVTLPCNGSDCTTPGVAEADATWMDVATFHTGENDGLWSSLYLAAEGFRYAVTGEAEALQTIEVLLAGEVDRMAITGVPGNFTRQYIPPDVAGIACPTDPQQYVPSADKRDNKWVRVDAAGCVETFDGTTSEWVVSTHCGLDAYAGWCWLDNVSKDEYSGHMFALGVLARLVDDDAVQATVAGLLAQVAQHLVDNRLSVVDWDGRVTEHGRFWAYALDDWPSFNAAMALDFFKIASVATGDATFTDWYDNCLMQRGGERDCIDRPPESPRPYVDYLPESSLYVGNGNSCESNWNNFSMHALSLHNLIWYERDPDTRAKLQRHLEDDFFAPADKSWPLADQHNAFFDFIFASQKALGPGSTGPAQDAVSDGVCQLRQFPATKHKLAVTCPPDKCVLADCTDRFDDPILGYARTVAERCTTGFVWWGSPYDVGDCTEDQRMIEPPTDYLLAYWMGRYYGFIGDND
jgi:hypothetical protein